MGTLHGAGRGLARPVHHGQQFAQPVVEASHAVLEIRKQDSVEAAGFCRLAGPDGELHIFLLSVPVDACAEIARQPHLPRLIAIAIARAALQSQARLHRKLLIEHHAFGIERSEEHTSELQSLMRISYAVFCLKKKKKYT